MIGAALRGHAGNWLGFRDGRGMREVERGGAEVR